MGKSIRYLRVVAATVILVRAASASAEIGGTWSGTWTKNGDSLPVVITFETSAKVTSATFDSDSLQVAGIPFSEVNIAGNRVHLILKGDQSTIIFSGLESGRTINGTLTENGTRGVFHLARARKRPAHIETRDVSFNNGDVKLAGTVLLPNRLRRHPAILFLQGSGPEARFANRWLAQRFARAGFVALIYDKRGVGQSTGDWKTAGFDELAGDAVAGVRLLQSLPNVDATKVGIYGHSQGGTIAPLVAVRSHDLAFVIASAAGGIDPAEIEEYSLENSLGITSLPDKEATDARAFVQAIVDVAYRGHPRAELEAAAAKFKARSWYFNPPPADNFYWSFSRRIADYLPAQYWRQVRAPVLLLYGGKDQRVPPNEDARAILSALHSGGDANVRQKIFPDADHTFSLPLTTGGWPKHVPAYAGIVISWTIEAIGLRHQTALR